MSRYTTLGLVIIGAVMTHAPTWAQVPADSVEPTQALKVFLDCRRCDFDHFRREAAFVNYVRDRQDAQVHVLVTSEETGGGRAYTFDFIGLREFAGRQDTLLFNARQIDTENEIRDGMLRTFTLGLMPFVAGSPIADRITIAYDPPEHATVTQQAESDPWNFWIFRVGGNGSVSAESRTRSYSVGGLLSANRTTDNWRIRFFARGRYNRNRFELDSTETLISTSENVNAEFGLAKSLGQHWAVGIWAEASRSTRFNYDFTLQGGPAVEFSIFPYLESTRRQLTLYYTIGVSYFNYDEVTIFEQTAETRPRQALILSAEAVQPWGSIHAFGEVTTFLHDLARHRLEAGGGFRIRVVKGLDFNMFGNVARIKDQIYLPLEDIPEEDILLFRRQLGTEFQLFANFGFSYTFGSIFNNVVNPRMDELF